MRHRRLEVFVYGNLSIGHQDCHLDVHLITISLPSDGGKQPLPMHILSALELGKYTISLPIESHRDYLLAQPNTVPSWRNWKQRLSIISWSTKSSSTGRWSGQRDLHSERGQHRRVFKFPAPTMTRSRGTSSKSCT